MTYEIPPFRPRRSRHLRALCGRSVTKCSCLRGAVSGNLYDHYLEEIVGLTAANPDLGEDIIAARCKITPACLQLILQQPATSNQQPAARKLRGCLKDKPEWATQQYRLAVDDEGRFFYAESVNPTGIWSSSLI